MAAEADRVKRSAEGVATLRLIGSYDPPPARSPDRLVAQMLTPAVRNGIALAPVRRVARAWVERRHPGAIAYQVARTRHFDVVLLRALDEGAEQLVVVGAGYDTRPYRFRERLTQATVFEVDHPTMLARRGTRAARAFPGVSPPLRVAVDLDVDDLDDCLFAAGLDARARTLVLCEGVTMFLAPSTVERTLAWAAGLAPGSALTFDYVAQAAIATPSAYAGGAAAARRFARAGEPWRWGFDPRSLPASLHGLSVRAHHGPEQMEQAYLCAADGTPAGSVPTFHGIVDAYVSAR